MSGQPSESVTTLVFGTQQPLPPGLFSTDSADLLLHSYGSLEGKVDELPSTPTSENLRLSSSNYAPIIHSSPVYPPPPEKRRRSSMVDVGEDVESIIKSHFEDGRAVLDQEMAKIKKERDEKIRDLMEQMRVVRETADKAMKRSVKEYMVKTMKRLDGDS